MHRYPNLESLLNASHGTKARVARDCGVSNAQISRIARGLSLPSVPLLRKIAKSLDADIDYLLLKETNESL